MKQELEYIFIGGAGRSGTTLVQKIMLAQQGVVGGAEFYHTKDIMDLYEKIASNTKNQVLKNAIPMADLKRQFRELLHSFFESYLKDDSRFISEKTPTNIEVVDPIFELLPTAYFLNVYRDGRAVLNSHFQVKKRARKQGKNLTEINLIRTSMYWRSCIRKGLEAKGKYPQRVFSLQYEELIRNPAQAFGETFDHLGIRANDSLNRPEEIQFEDKKQEAHVNEVWYTEKMYNQGLAEDRIDQWKKELSFFHRFGANVIMYPELKELDYSVPSYYRIFHLTFDYLFHWKSNLKKWLILRPIIQLKRRLQ